MIGEDLQKFSGSRVMRTIAIVEDEIGSFARPEYFHHASALPKTRSGKTSRRILRKIAANDRDLGDMSTLIEEAAVYDLFNSKKFLNRDGNLRVEKT
ncbi:hypothetical protein AVEN_43298-1 [Araneus ventricosus]|uniref:AMP-binding enzyme C-terminal domain-containing protein n=1 Tax=Araneus ventricosus TaxID=182803 RepID=A0A4Y2GCY8_ARAVE|nr:hypothetical protein AVEN_43298-1 [Araneus ventricosus]